MALIHKILNNLPSLPSWLKDVGVEISYVGFLLLVGMESLHLNITQPLIEHLRESPRSLKHAFVNLQWNHPLRAVILLAELARLVLLCTLLIINPITLAITPFVILYGAPLAILLALTAGSVALMLASVFWLLTIYSDEVTNQQNTMSQHLQSSAAWLGFGLSIPLTSMTVLLTLTILAPLLLATMCISKAVDSESTTTQKILCTMALIPAAVLMSPFAALYLVSAVWFVLAFVGDLFLQLSSMTLHDRCDTSLPPPPPPPSPTKPMKPIMRRQDSNVSISSVATTSSYVSALSETDWMAEDTVTPITIASDTAPSAAPSPHLQEKCIVESDLDPWSCTIM